MSISHHNRTTLGEKTAGFTLIELVVVVVIIGILVAAALATYSLYIQREAVIKTKDNVSIAFNAIAAFRNEYGYYPCPASGTDPFAIATDCSGTPATDTISSGGVRIGVVPLTAQAPDGTSVQIAASNGIIDGYRRRLTYAVTEEMAIDEDRYNAAAGNGRITIVQSEDPTTTISSATDYIVFSNGEDGRGAYGVNGGGLYKDCNTAALDGENCNGDAIFADNALSPRSFTGDDSNYDDFFVASTSDAREETIVALARYHNLGHGVPGAGCSVIYGPIHCRIRVGPPSRPTWEEDDASTHSGGGGSGQMRIRCNSGRALILSSHASGVTSHGVPGTEYLVGCVGRSGNPRFIDLNELRHDAGHAP